MPYPFLRNGNRIPAVGVAQKLLNGRAGSSLVADGQFGPKTESVARSFQRPRGLSADGIIGKETWNRLKQETDNLDIIDVVDVWDPDLFSMEAADIRRAGGNPIVIGGMSNGVEQAVTEVLRVARQGKVFILRFHGHGAPGVAGVSDGHGELGDHASSIHMGNWTYLQPIMARLKPIFGPYGCIQFMHCKTGRGTTGLQMLQQIANTCSVPATGGVNDQLGGGLDTFRFEGPTQTGFPAGHNLKSWSESLPDFVGMSVP